MEQEQTSTIDQETTQHLPMTTANLEAQLWDTPVGMRVVVAHNGRYWEAEAVEVTDPDTGEQVLLIKAF